MTQKKRAKAELIPDPVYELVVCKGVAGFCVYLNDTRICGPKPWGGGDTVHRWKVERSRILDAIPEQEP